jgi:protein TonB
VKLAGTFGLVAALLVHALFLLFGGLFVGTGHPGGTAAPEVDLVDTDLTRPDETPPLEPPPEAPPEAEPAPDADAILRDLEASPSDDLPALDAATLSALEAALRGEGGGGDFLRAASLQGGGRIGGTGSPDGGDDAFAAAFSLADLDQKPRAMFQATPVYPNELRGKKVEGIVTVLFVVDADGRVVDPRVESSTHAGFDAAALAAVKKWKFEPAVRGGQRVACRMRVPIRFPRT